MPFPWFRKRKGRQPPEPPFGQNVQQSMLSHAEERLAAWLRTNIDASWASMVNSYVVEESRVCAEALPYRIYLYDLEDPLGQLGYEALQRRRDAPGDVFEHKQGSLGGKRVGIFMYRVR
jgi:hypothetical protein